MYTHAPKDQPAKVIGFMIACAIAFPTIVAPYLLPLIRSV
jgi:hypothetical protein